MSRTFTHSGSALIALIDAGRQAVFLRGGFEALGAGDVGAVLLVGARIGEVLDCSGAVLRNESGPALRARSMHVGESLFLGDGFEAIGGGTGHVTLHLAGARVGGVLEFDPARLEHLQDPRRRLAVDGLTYQGLPHVGDEHDWLELIRTATPEYAAQPYQQLAAAHRAAGHDGAARQVLIQQRRDQLARRALTDPIDRAWARLTGVTLGYGYQPWRALLLLLVVVLTSIALAVGVGGRGGRLTRTSTPAPSPAAAAIARTPPAAPCSTVLQIGVGLPEDDAFGRLDVVVNNAGFVRGYRQ